MTHITDMPPWAHDDFTCTGGDPWWLVVIMAMTLGGAVLLLLLDEMGRPADE